MIVGLARALACALMLAAVALPSAARQLLSIEGIDLAASEFVSTFEIRTWGIRVLSVCRVPRGWGVAVTQDATAQGVLAGNAGHGVAFSDASDVKKRFQHLFLTDDPDEILDSPRGSVPQTFNGRIRVGVYGRDRLIWRRLTSRNYVLTPANLCPDPDE